MKNLNNLRYLTILLALIPLTLLIVFSSLKSKSDSYFRISAEKFQELISKDLNTADKILMQKDISIHGTIYRIEREEEITIIYFENKDKLEIPVILEGDQLHHTDHLKIGMKIEIKGHFSRTQQGLQVKGGIII